MADGGPSLRAALRAAEVRLAAAGVERAALDARVLLRHLLGISSAHLYLHLEAPLAPEQAAEYARGVERRADGEPVAYLTGRREFFGLELRVSPDVLIPRPETELLVERAIAALPAQARVVDVGTGSGAIAVATARFRPDVRLLAVDRSPAACRVARANADEHQVAGRVGVACSDLLSAVAWPLDGVLANLPYLRRDELAMLPPEVRREPAGALDGGPDGLDLYRRLFAQLAQARPLPRLILCEIDPSQAEAMRTFIAGRLPDRRVNVLADLAGRARVVEVRSARD